MSLFIDIMASRAVALANEANNCNYISRHKKLFKAISAIVLKLNLVDETVKATTEALDDLHQFKQSTSLTQEQETYLSESISLVRTLQSSVLGSAFHPSMQPQSYRDPVTPRSGLRV